MFRGLFKTLNAIVTATLNQNQFAALISFEFNTGAGRNSGVFSYVDQNKFVSSDGDSYAVGQRRKRFCARLV